jgi:hypothetical protein
MQPQWVVARSQHLTPPDSRRCGEMPKRFEQLHGKVEATVLGVVAVVVAMAWRVFRFRG